MSSCQCHHIDVIMSLGLCLVQKIYQILTDDTYFQQSGQTFQVDSIVELNKTQYL